MDMQNSLKLATLAASCLAMSVTSSAFAWSSGRTHITSMAVYNDGHVIVRFEDFNGNVSCPGGGNQFSLGLASDVGQNQMIDVAMAAFQSGKPVAVQTAPGRCDGGQEVVLYLDTYGT
jgi:hypothetical protein